MYIGGGGGGGGGGAIEYHFSLLCLTDANRQELKIE